jgi:ferredoxin
MRIRVDANLCTGHALCAHQAPTIYLLDDLGFNVTPPSEVPPGLEDDARRGAQSCPERAITTED